MGGPPDLEKSEDGSSSNSRPRNAARTSCLAGHPVLKKYTSPLDTAHLITPQEFNDQFINNKPGSRYNASSEVYEVRRSASKIVVPTSPTKSLSPTTPVPPSATESTISGATLHDNNDDVASTACLGSLGFGRRKSMKRTKDDTSDEYTPKSPKRLQRSQSWKLWLKREK